MKSICAVFLRISWTYSKKNENYRKFGAGKPCAGHKMEMIPLDSTNMLRVSSEDSLGEVDEIGS